MHKLSRNLGPFRVISTINPPLLLRPNASPISHQTYPDFINKPIPLCGLTGKDKQNSSQGFPIFPSFPFGYCFNPIASAELGKLGVGESEHVESDDARTIWADSVKKKRKRKMNKHKYKKLRKRLRRKTWGPFCC